MKKTLFYGATLERDSSVAALERHWFKAFYGVHHPKAALLLP
jgi:hypothetical protein